MKKSVISLFFLLIPLLISAQTTDVEAVRRKVNKAAAEMRTMECDFVQTKQLKMLNDKMVSKGRMWYQQKDKLRWEYTAPYTYTFILNGTKVMLRNNSRNDVIDTNQNKMFREIARIMMNSVVGKCLNDDKEYKVDIKSVTNEYVATLTPLRKNMKQLFQKIVLHFDQRKNVVTKVELLEKNGDKTVIELKNIKTNHDVNSTVFAVS